ncbi:diguanylate cyclase domain-containing protein [Butyrivibrio sp. NC3005]|uniref:diguanylate cyclase domain-containing protein n=1 Tax=Butyrivibrio sp. NC3005 TaxID=1280685 RepID=UPI000408A77F|nr:diguanylate cyclase [Butyrivibrio sp. NC3005]
MGINVAEPEKNNQISKQYKKVKIVEILVVFVCFLFAVIYHYYSYKMISFNSFFGPFTILLVVFTLIIFFLIYELLSFIPKIEDIENSADRNLLDNLTGIPNRLSCDLIFEMYGKNKSIENVGCAIITIGNLVTINESIGRDAGNQAIIDFSWMLEDISEDFGFVGRNGGNEFLLIIQECNRQLMDDFFRNLEQRVEKYNKLNLVHPISPYYKYVLNSELQATRFSDIITEAYHRMHTRPGRIYNKFF